MTIDLDDIRITGVDESASGSGDQASALVDVVLTLSAFAPSEWATYFNQRWEQHIYMMKRRARVDRSRLTIHCVPNELEKDHLPELRKIMEETNDWHRRHVANQASEEHARAEREKAQKDEIKRLKGIKFD
jgi:hypothetical protein